MNAATVMSPPTAGGGRGARVADGERRLSAAGLASVIGHRRLQPPVVEVVAEHDAAGREVHGVAVAHDHVFREVRLVARVRRVVDLDAVAVVEEQTRVVVRGRDGVRGLGVRAHRVSNASTGIAVPALSPQLAEVLQVVARDDAVGAVGRTSMPSKRLAGAAEDGGGKGRRARVRRRRPARGSTASAAEPLIWVTPLRSLTRPVTRTLSPMATPGSGCGEEDEEPSERPGVDRVRRSRRSAGRCRDSHRCGGQPVTTPSTVTAAVQGRCAAPEPWTSAMVWVTSAAMPAVRRAAPPRWRPPRRLPQLRSVEWCDVA